MDPRNKTTVTCIGSFTPKFRSSENTVNINLVHLAQNINLSKDRGGIEKVKYSTNTSDEKQNYNRPAMKTFPGTFCESCDSRNGASHDEHCEDPRDINLKLTVGGFAKIIKNRNISDQKNKFLTEFNIDLIKNWNKGTLNNNHRFVFYENEIENSQQKDYDLNGNTSLYHRDFSVKRGKKVSKEKLKKTRVETSYSNSVLLTIITSPDKPGESYCDSNRSNVRVSKNGKLELFRIPYTKTPVFEKTIIEKINSSGAVSGNYKFTRGNIDYHSFKIEKQAFENVELLLGDIQKKIKKSGNKYIQKINYKPDKGFVQIELKTDNMNASVILYLKGKIMIDIKRPLKNSKVSLVPAEVLHFSTDILKFLETLIDDSFEVSKNIKPDDKNTWNGNEPTVCRKSVNKMSMKESIRPKPYSFKGKCPEWYQYLPPEGKFNKKDKRFYPCCAVLANTKESEYRHRLIEGLDLPNPDLQSGTLVPGSTEVGATSEVLVNGEWLKVKVCTRTKNGKTFTVSKGNKIYENINRSQFMPESRSFRGVRKYLNSLTQEKIIEKLRDFNMIKMKSQAEKRDIPKYVKSSPNYKDVTFSYISPKEAKKITSEYVVHHLNRPGALPVKWFIAGPPQSTKELIIIYGSQSMSFSLLTSKNNSLYPSKYKENGGSAALWTDTEPWKLEIITKQHPFKRTKIGARGIDISGAHGKNYETGIIDNLATKSKGLSFIWKPGSNRMILYHIDAPKLPVFFQIIKKGKLPNQWIIGYKNTAFTDIGLVPIKGKIKLKIGEYYKANPNFTSEGISKYKPFSIIGKVNKTPVTEKKIREYVNYLYSWPVIERQTINWKNEWEIDLKRYHSF